MAQMRLNWTDSSQELLPDERLAQYEDCLWEFLVGRERPQSLHLAHPLLSPPPEYPMRITVQHLVVEQVDTVNNEYLAQLSFCSWPEHPWSSTCSAT